MPTLQLKYSPLDTLIINSEPGERVSPTTGQDSRHDGMDFKAPIGKTVYNAHDGTVIFAGSSGGYGNTIIIQDQSSLQSTLYGHLSRIDVSKGDLISGKSIIGSTGNSGPKGTAPHFHFEVINADTSNDVLTRTDGKITKGGRENPRTYIASSPFASMLSPDVHSGELGIGEKIGDQFDNTMVRDPIGDYYGREVKFSGLGGDDTYYLRLSFTGKRKVLITNTQGRPVLDANGEKQFRVETHIVAARDVVNDSDKDGRIVIVDEERSQSVSLTGNASPYLDSSGNILPNKWSLNGFDLTRSNNNLIITKAGQDPNNSNVGKITVADFPFSKPKAFLRNIFLSLFSVVFLFSSQAFAAETKPKTAQTKQEFEDPDLKLSIEELRKKYPIDWLAKKYGDYNEYCRTDDCEYNCPTKPKNLVCTFYYDPFRIGYFEDAKKVSLDDFSESEIKSVFVNYDQYFSRLTSVGRDDPRFEDVVDVFIDHFMKTPPGVLTKKEKKILIFAFSKKVFDSYWIQCANGKHYFRDKNYCDEKTGWLELKQKFQSLFSSKFNLNLN